MSLPKEKSIAKILAEKIISIHAKAKEGLQVVAICGAADLGKSYLSNEIMKALREMNLTTNHLTLDSYLLDRAERHKQGLSGYQIATYDVEEVVKNLINCKNHQEIEYRPYDHTSGTKSQYPQTLNPGDILLFDGLHTMHESFMPFIDYSIFIYTTDDQLKRIRSAADLVKRNYTLEFSKIVSKREFKLYKKYVELYKEQADCTLLLEHKWHYLPQFNP